MNFNVGDRVRRINSRNYANGDTIGPEVCGTVIKVYPIAGYKVKFDGFDLAKRVAKRFLTTC